MMLYAHMFFSKEQPLPPKKRRRRGEIADKKTTYISLEDDIT